MMLRCFIGYDPRQPVAANVLAHSIARRASKPVSIIRLQLSQLPMTRRGLTEFTYSRFLVPYLSDYRGLSVFFDSDMLCLGDIHEVVPLAEAWGAQVCVVDNPVKFERSSFMVFNNAGCKLLIPEYIDNPLNHLLSLDWASEVGTLPKEWNHLVGYDAPNLDAKVVHFTMGVPCWKETWDCEFGEAWRKEAAKSMSSVSFQELMGRSVHVAHLDKLVQAR